MEDLQKKYDKIRVKFEDALYRYRKSGSNPAPLIHVECEILFARLLQLRDEMGGA